jgi:hypothetical protein
MNNAANKASQIRLFSNYLEVAINSGKRFKMGRIFPADVAKNSSARAYMKDAEVVLDRNPTHLPRCRAETEAF